MRVGVIGGGQLARMLALSAAPLGVRVLAYDPALDACTEAVAPVEHGDFDDLPALHAFAEQCDFITFDFENVSAPALTELSATKPVRPNARALATTQDRALEKALFLELGIAVAEFVEVGDLADSRFRTGTLAYPAILKTRRLGYDGKGQTRVDTADAVHAAFSELGEVPCVLETRVQFSRELSLIAVRGTDGELLCYPLVENVHVDGILSTSLAPARVTPELEQQACECATRLADALDYTGVFAVEFFQLDGHLLANEVAPRVHNSGHWTIEGAETSQFENHIRAVTGLPLGSTAPRGVSCMLNWIGKMPDVKAALRVPGLHWHDYGKEPRLRRKVGHATITAKDFDELAQRLELAGQVLGREWQVAPALAAMRKPV